MPTELHSRRFGLGLLAALIACGGAEAGVQRVNLGVTAEARPADCEVMARPNRPAPAGTRPLAELQVHCRQRASDASTRVVCQETLRRAACEAGADVAWSYHFAREVGGMRLEAKVGLKPAGLTSLSACLPTCSPGHACQAGYCVEVCDPTCEAGFVCESGACEPICRPRCGEGELCTAERVCSAPPEDAGVTDGAAGDDAAGDGGAAVTEAQETDAGVVAEQDAADAGVAEAQETDAPAS